MTQQMQTSKGKQTQQSHLCQAQVHRPGSQHGRRAGQTCHPQEIAPVYITQVCVGLVLP